MINEVFYSVQGEGFLIGKLALFVRFQGCNLRCAWCDEKSALDFDKMAKDFNQTLKEIEAILNIYNPNLVVLTGGEPTLNELFLEVFFYFKSLKKLIQIETNATVLKEEIKSVLMDYEKTYITLSPKYLTDYKIDQGFLDFEKNIELKIVVDEHLNEDILSRDYMRHFIQNGLLVLQPLWENNQVMFLEKAIKLAGKFNGRVIPQMHKLLNLK